MPTTEPLAWQRKDFESKYGPAARFTSPSGFHIELVGTSNVLRLLVQLADRSADDYITIPDGTRLATIDRKELILMDCDPWINPDFRGGQSLGPVGGLAQALGHFLLEKAWTK